MDIYIYICNNKSNQGYYVPCVYFLLMVKPKSHSSICRSTIGLSHYCWSLSQRRWRIHHISGDKIRPDTGISWINWIHFAIRLQNLNETHHSMTNRINPKQNKTPLLLLYTQKSKFHDAGAKRSYYWEFSGLNSFVLLKEEGKVICSRSLRLVVIVEDESLLHRPCQGPSMLGSLFRHISEGAGWRAGIVSSNRSPRVSSQ